MDKEKLNNINSDETEINPGYIWPDWYHLLSKFQVSNNLKGTWQVLNTTIPYFCLWYLIIRSIQLGYSYKVTLLLIMTAAAFLVRMFILFHDCAHNSLFTSRNMNIVIGYFFSVFLCISFADWRFTHLRHHWMYANLDSRGYGDVWTITKKEYENSSTLQRLRYRVYRNPLVLFAFGAFLLSKRPEYFMVKPRERVDIILTYMVIAAVAFTASNFIGWSTYFLIQLPVLWFAGGVGVWLFYLNHQFEGGYWARKDDWNPLSAALKGSSFLKLPAVLNWFSSNIGYHHLHHLNPVIPNYNLRECFNTVMALQAKDPTTITKVLNCFSLKLWDEDMQKMVPFP